MSQPITGTALKYGDNINTDIISPPAYMELPIQEAAKYAMSPVDETFAGRCRPGDIFVAEKNLGSGSSRETAPLTLRALGIQTIVAQSYARIFYRNCINLGILAIECPETGRISEGDRLEIDYRQGIIRNLTTGDSLPCDPIPDHIMDLVGRGGLVAYLKERHKT